VLQRSGKRGLRAARLLHSCAVHRGARGAPCGLGAPDRRSKGEKVVTIAARPSKHDVTDLGLAEAGARRITWAAREMPVLSQIRERFAKERPFVDLRIGACLHVTADTANLMLVLRDGGARAALGAAKPPRTPA